MSLGQTNPNIVDIDRNGLSPEEERAKVARFVIEHEESWIPTEFREAMDVAAQGKMVTS
jgi:hypothetical protein